MQSSCVGVGLRGGGKEGLRRGPMMSSCYVGAL